MTEYWKSVGNYYCDYCKLHVRNDKFNRLQHEASPRHQGALKRQVREIYRKSERETREALYASRELARIGGKVAEAQPKLDDGLKRVNIGTRPKKKEQIQTLDDPEIYRAALAAQAVPGQWSTVGGRTADLDSSAKSSCIKSEADQEEEKPDLAETDNPAQLVTTAIHKRRRDGADEDLIAFKVLEKQIALPVEDELDGPSITFKKKKKKITDKGHIKAEPIF